MIIEKKREREGIQEWIKEGKELCGEGETKTKTEEGGRDRERREKIKRKTETGKCWR